MRQFTWSIIIGAILVIPLAFVCLIHWPSITLGTIAFILGSVLALLFEDWKKYRWVKWLLIVSIPLIPATGGLLTTLGWNKLAGSVQDRDLIVAAATELCLNKTYIYVISQCRDTFIDGAGSLSTPAYVVPTAREIRQVLTRGTSFQEDDSLIHALTVYAMAVDRLIPRLEYVNLFCSQPNPIEMKKNVVSRELGQEGNSALEYIAKAHKQLHTVLETDYPWAFEKAENRIGVELLNAIENMELNPKD